MYTADLVITDSASIRGWFSWYGREKANKEKEGEESTNEKIREESLDKAENDDQSLLKESFSAHINDGGKGGKKGRGSWPEYTNGIFESDTPAFSRLWEYVQRQLEAPGTYFSQNKAYLKELEELPFPEKGCKYAVTLKNEKSKVYPDVLR